MRARGLRQPRHAQPGRANTARYQFSPSNQGERNIIVSRILRVLSSDRIARNDLPLAMGNSQRRECHSKRLGLYLHSIERRRQRDEVSAKR